MKDIDAEENTLFLQRAYLRASLRALDPVRSTPEVAVQSFRTPEALEPGRVYEIKLSLGGNRSRVAPRTSAGSLHPGAQSHPPARDGSDNGLALMLPILVDEVAAAPPPPCGVLLLQPCRPKPPYVEPPE